MSCGGNCACGARNEQAEKLTCEAPKEGVVLNADGKCPCGKLEEECCHKKAKQEISGNKEK